MTIRRFLGTLLLAAIALSAMNPSAIARAEGVDYERDIKPVLKARCYACHGALKQEAGLRLDTGESIRRGGDSGAAVTGGLPDASRLLQRVSANEVAERMPPEGEPLSAAQIELLRAWIRDGAKSPDSEQAEADPREHWAFQPITRPAVPQTDESWVRNPIDSFLQQRHQQQGIKPQPEAPRIILLRRLHLDLIGLPPTLEEIAACEADPSPDWYERTVQRLLDDPRHGERWARHWMDIWRYSDWWGLGDQLRNSQKHIWHWRDWIVESLNDDTPYDEMVRLMLAADELHPNDLGKLRATGYLARNYWLFNRPQWMEETVEHVSKGFLGLTMNCTRCHDHKYDPFEQVDFYRLRAFFEPYHVRVDVVPGEADLARDGIPRAFDGLLEEPTYLYVRGDERNPDKSRVIAPGVPAILAFDELRIEPISLPLEAWRPEQRPWVAEAHLSAARSRVTAAEAARQTALDKLTAAKQAEADSDADANQRMTLDAEQELAVAEASLGIAQAELESVLRRIAAHRAEANEGEASRAELAAAAVRAERQVVVAKARHRVAVAEQAVQRAASDQKQAAEKTLQTEREALETSLAAAAEVLPTDTYTRFVGALWTPTRFFNSGKDDPEVTFPPQSSGRRTALANWITDRRNPLTARVAVNHIWTRHVGQPLVPTMFDFGRKGTPPTHPELLDWLASELMDSGWSMKHLHWVIVTSAAYRLSSSVGVTTNADGEIGRKGERERNASSPPLPVTLSPSLTLDPENKLWWRRLPMRMESQVIRDSLLAMAGTLDETRGGPPVLPAEQATSTRRSLYFFHSNNERNLFLTTFDEALVKDCYRREQSIVPQQALALSNSELALDAAERIAARLAERSADDETFVRHAFRLVTGINPGGDELAASLQAVEAWRKLPGSHTAAARANFVWALINHNDFVTLR